MCSAENADFSVHSGKFSSKLISHVRVGQYPHTVLLVN